MSPGGRVLDAMERRKRRELNPRPAHCECVSPLRSRMGCDGIGKSPCSRTNPHDYSELETDHHLLTLWRELAKTGLRRLPRRQFTRTMTG